MCFWGETNLEKKVIIEIIQNIDKLESRYELNRLTKNGLHITFVDIETIKVYNGGMRAGEGKGVAEGTSNHISINMCNVMT